MITLGMEHAELMSKLVEVLDRERNPVNRQVAIELLVVNHCMRMGELDISIEVANGVHKHATQLIKQAYEEGWIK